MSEKCNKYESLFVFGTQEQLEEHLAVCAECREEHEKMNKTASVAKEVAPYYKNFSRKNNLYPIAVKMAAGLIVVVLAYFAMNQNIFDTNLSKYNISYNTSESVISEMGLPTDDYGLLMVY